jgi:PAS domain S-box-containing protein
MAQKRPAQVVTRVRGDDPGGRIGAGQWVVMGLSVAVLALVFQSAAAHSHLHIFELRFNPYALLSLAAVISNLVLIILISRVKGKTEDLVWFSLFITTLLLWAIAEFFTRVSADSSAFTFWWSMGSPPSYFMPAMLFMFVLSYTRPRQSRHVWTVVSLFVTTLMLILFDLRTSLFNSYTDKAVATPWNGAVVPGSQYYVLSLWFLVLLFLSVGMLVGFYRRTLEPTLRRQTKLFVIAALIPLVVGSITDGLLPALDIFGLPPLAVMLTAATGVIITYGILRYRFLTFNPALVASNILGTINEAVLGIEPDLGISYANRGAEQLLGYAPQQFGKLQFGDFLSQDWDAKMLKKTLFAPVTEHGSGEYDSIDLRTAKGKIVTAKLSISQVVDDGAFEGYLVVMTDITTMARATEIIEEQVEVRTRQVHEAQATLVTSINSIKLGFVITDAKPAVIRLNTVAHEVFCGSRSHAAGDCHEVTMAKVEAMMGGSTHIAEHIKECLRRQLPQELKDVTFNNRNWRAYLSPMVVGRESIGCAVLLQDTTEERILERSRDEFFSIASHELRTPLTSIKGNSSLIMDYYKELLKDPTLKEMVEDIHESSNRLIEIVNDFLDMSRLEQGRIEYHMEGLPVSKVIEEVAYGMGTLIKQKGLHLQLGHNIRRLDAVPAVIADKNRLKQILFNLLGNAVKFTEKGGRITVDAEAARDSIKLTVTDTGAGISPEHQTLLFRKFQQATDSILTRDDTRGTGLGLYISRLLATGMGGTLVLERSVPGKGSTFALKLLVATPARLKHLQAAVKVIDSHSGLVVEEKEA